MSDVELLPVFVMASILFGLIFYVIIQELPHLYECNKLYKIEKIYDNLTLQQKDYMFQNCIS